MLRIVGRQIDRHDEVSEETVEFMTEGKAYKKGDATYLVYEESEMSGLAGVKTTLRIGGDGSVRILQRCDLGLDADVCSWQRCLELRPGNGAAVDEAQDHVGDAVGGIQGDDGLGRVVVQPGLVHEV